MRDELQGRWHSACGIKTAVDLTQTEKISQANARVVQLTYRSQLFHAHPLDQQRTLMVGTRVANYPLGLMSAWAESTS